jgi:uncharacterized protein (TIGR03435 family)
MRKTRGIAVAVVFLLSLAGTLVAQNRPLAFEIASVKSSPTSRYVPGEVDPQIFRKVMSLADAIEWAYDIHNYQLSGGPAWLRHDYYEIQARTGAPPQEAKCELCFRLCLATGSN